LPFFNTPKAGQLFRLNRAIAHTGFCSRRDADALILKGRVKVNGKKVESLNALVHPNKDILEVDGRQLTNPCLAYVLLNKPKGIITSCEDEKGRRTVLDLLPPSLKHLKPAGRLDKDSQGLLLLTNDGSLIQALTHPSHHVPKTYLVTVAGQISPQNMRLLASGVSLSEGPTSPAKVRLLRSEPGSCCFEIVIHEGKNRQIRRMCGTLGMPVLNLLRVAISGLQLKGLQPGSWRHLSPDELGRLRQVLAIGQSKDPNAPWRK
jgi:pseudouridine synthase